MKRLNYHLPVSDLSLSAVLWVVIFGISSLNVGRYGYLDDYSNLWNAKQNALDVLKLSFSQGRPILGLIVLFVFLPLSNIDQLIFIHIFSSFCLATLGVILHQIFNFINAPSKRFDKFTIFWISALPLLVTSGFLIFGAWPSTFPALLGLTFGSFGVLKILKEPKSKIGGFLVSLNVLVYQPNFILLVLIFFIAQMLLNDSSGSFETNVTWRSYRLVTSFIVINAFVSLACIQFAKVHNFSSGSRGALTTEYSQKLSWFVDTVVPRIIYFYTPWQPNSKFLTLLVISFITGGILLYAGAKSKNKFFIILLVIGPLSVAPNILIAENWASSRSLLAPQWLFSFFVFLPIVFFISKFLVSNNLRFVASICIVIALISNLYNINVVNFKKPQEIELKIAREFLTVEKCKKLKTTTQSSWTDSLARKVSYDEFGIPSTAQPWVPIPLTKLICLEKGVKVGNLVVILLVNSKTEEGNVNFAKLIQNYKNSHN